MKFLLLTIPIFFCLQDTTKVQKPVKLFFEQKTIEQRAEDINCKLDSLLLKLETMNDSIKIK